MPSISSSSRSTAITSHGEVDVDSSEIYGTLGGPLAFRLGNGGAGPTGILKRLSEDFLDLCAPGHSVPWICNHSRNTQLALLRDAIDFSLTYERDQEKISVDEGWAVDGGVAFHDHFVIVGPRANPAGISFSDTPAECFRKIHAAAIAGRTLFHSRADGSATMIKERQIWDEVGVSPWSTSSDSSWYKMSTLAPAPALVGADKAGAYLLSDRSTLLRQTSLRTISNSTVFYEPRSPDDFLMNTCAILLPPEPLPLATKFSEYLLSERGQQIIATFGSTEVGAPFFASLKEGFASPKLRGGFPENGKWLVLSANL